MSEMVEALETLIESAVTIPAIPATLANAERIIDSENASASDAWRLIERDPSLAVQILRLVNSAAHGVRQPVNTIHVACSLAGLQAIKHIVLRATVLDLLANGSHRLVGSINVGWLWDHSFKTALAAQLLVDSVPWSLGFGRDDAYTCGLVHDIGKILLLEGQPAEVEKALELSRETGLPLAKAEQQTMGFNHAHVAGLLLRRWNLAPLLQDAVMHHHGASDDPEAWVLGFLLHAANAIAHEVAEGDGGWIGDCCDADSMEALGVPEVRLQSIRDQVREVSIAL